MTRTCRTCREPLKSQSLVASQCIDCESDRRDSRPALADPLTGQRRAIVVMLTGLNVPDPITVTDQVFKQLAADLPGLLKARALQLAGLSERPLKANNTSGHVGIDQHRGRWRARVWRGGKIVFTRCHADRKRAIDARAKYLADNPC